jgi:hypothetical protein
LGDAAGKIGFFEHEAFDRGRDGLDIAEELLGISRETPVIDFVALIVELSQHAVFGVGIQAEPCYRGTVIHNKPLVVVHVLNNLADAWRIRICSFTESLNCSIQQVVRFSIYQQATRDGVSSSAIASGGSFVLDRNNSLWDVLLALELKCQLSE